MRNPFDIAFNHDGELFTYDADMEWDIGEPWYRPTRVNHIISGAEFGFRNGSAKWPAAWWRWRGQPSCGVAVCSMARLDGTGHV